MIWFDLDNSPHVLIFKNIIRELEERGEEYIVTARDFAQTFDLLKLFNINHELISHHAGSSKILKLLNLFQRGIKLNKFLKSNSLIPNLAVSHGSRTQVLTSSINKIPSVVMMDYEFTENKIFNFFSNVLLFPVFIPNSRLLDAGINIKKVIKYNAFKEELYLCDFNPKENFRNEIGIEDEKLLVVIRPPSFSSNYHNKKSEKILLKLIEILINVDNSAILYISRTQLEKDFVRKKFKNSKIIIPEKVYDGLQLIYSADFVFSGGGTMNREAALLGVETYSFFTGKKPYLDEYLEEIGRLNFITSISDLNKIEFKKKEKKKILIHNPNIISELTDLFLDLKNKTKKEYFYASTIS